MSPKKLEM